MEVPSDLVATSSVRNHQSCPKRYTQFACGWDALWWIFKMFVALGRATYILLVDNVQCLAR